MSSGFDLVSITRLLDYYQEAVSNESIGSLHIQFKLCWFIFYLSDLGNGVVFIK